ncbi:unnamed protein product [Mytilus edulis]|uniref:Uncharacterized protein n=1 Tax=Mytilus edulis TaxID=6550 RepID=A0A8S3PT98_MYTED|nr:unnamed protein product [Mytilus edulis]
MYPSNFRSEVENAIKQKFDDVPTDDAHKKVRLKLSGDGTKKRKLNASTEKKDSSHLTLPDKKAAEEGKKWQRFLAPLSLFSKERVAETIRGVRKEAHPRISVDTNRNEDEDVKCTDDIEEKLKIRHPMATLAYNITKEDDLPSYDNQNINGATDGEPQDINGTTDGEPKDINGTTVRDTQNINGATSVDITDINGAPGDEFQDTNDTTGGEPEDINGTTGDETQDINGTTDGESQNVNGTTSDKTKDTTVGETQNHATTGDEPLDINGTTCVETQNIEGTPANETQNINGTTCGQTQNVNGATGDEPQNIKTKTGDEHQDINVTPVDETKFITATTGDEPQDINGTTVDEPQVTTAITGDEPQDINDTTDEHNTCINGLPHDKNTGINGTTSDEHKTFNCRKEDDQHRDDAIFIKFYENGSLLDGSYFQRQTRGNCLFEFIGRQDVYLEGAAISLTPEYHDTRSIDLDNYLSTFTNPSNLNPTESCQQSRQHALQSNEHNDGIHAHEEVIFITDSPEKCYNKQQPQQLQTQQPQPPQIQQPQQPTLQERMPTPSPYAAQPIRVIGSSYNKRPSTLPRCGLPSKKPKGGENFDPMELFNQLRID